MNLPSSLLSISLNSDQRCVLKRNHSTHNFKVQAEVENIYKDRIGYSEFAKNLKKQKLFIYLFRKNSFIR